MRTIICLGALILVLAAENASADEKADAAQLDQLVSKIKLAIPRGWEVAFEISDDRWRRDRPMLFIRSREKLPVEYVGFIGRPAAGDDPNPYIVQEIAQVEFEFVPYLTPQEYAKVRKANDELEERRRKYELTRLGKDKGNYKGLFSPQDFVSQTGDHTPMLKEYAFLWLRTEPKPLPTHYYGTLAVETHDIPPIWSGTIKIHLAEKEAEHQKVMKVLESLFTPYEKPQ